MIEAKSLLKSYVYIKNISIEITRFYITSCVIIPFTSATVYLNLLDSEENVYQRSFFLQDEEYTRWTDDEYVFTYVNDNISKIFIN